MRLIITSKTMEFDKLKEEITTLQQELLPLIEVTQFTNLDELLNKKINKIELDTIHGKKEKLLCDKLD